MERPPIVSRRARDLTGIVLLVVGLLAVAVPAVTAAFSWHPLAGTAAIGVCLTVVGVAFGAGRE